MFNFKTTKKQIEVFERNAAEILKTNFPSIAASLESSSNQYSIQFIKKPCGIYLSRDFSVNNFQEKIKEQETAYDVYGLRVFNKRLNEYENITLFFHNDLLTLIELKNPSQFHADYDISRLQIGELRTKQVYSENQDRRITREILKNISEDQLNQLELDKAIEIEINENLYYTILDMEDGNYIAVTKSGKVYRLNHEHFEKVKEISDDIVTFFNMYKGNKSNLKKLMY